MFTITRRPISAPDQLQNWLPDTLPRWQADIHLPEPNARTVINGPLTVRPPLPWHIVHSLIHTTDATWSEIMNKSTSRRGATPPPPSGICAPCRSATRQATEA